MGVAVQNPETPFWVMAGLAVLCGLGGGNFASSMAHISFFFPKREKGTALGLNAGLGNLGVSAAQFLVPVVITAGVFGGEPLLLRDDGNRPIWLQNAGFVWVPLIGVAALAAWLGMNDIASARASLREQAVIFRRKHTWIMCWLYLGTFGSFIGFSAGFPLLMQLQFSEINPARYVFLGPLIGALSRPLGGWLGDRFGGARVTLWAFVVMALAAFGAILLLGQGQGASFWGFFTTFMLLFLVSGIGNGSTFRMVPLIFLTLHQRNAAGPEAKQAAAVEAGKEAAAVLGFTSAIGAYGAFFIPSSYGASISLTGEPGGALWVFIVFYLTCVALTWWYYARRGAEIPC
jgi:NNP family nitrate/nitrite transporter-like MFS transporter